MKTRDKMVFGLVAGRHDLPVEYYIYKEKEIKDVTDVAGLEYIARFMLETLGQRMGEPSDSFPENVDVELYVTGLTPALIAALNVLKQFNSNVTLKHWNATSGDYYPQKVRF